MSQVWKRQKLDKHAWAFIYFCRRQGDIVKIQKKIGNHADIKVIISAKK